MNLHCEDEEGKELTNNAMMVAPYTLLYTYKRGVCHNFVSYKLPTTNILYFKDESPQPIRIYGKYLYGYVEEICTANMIWQRSNSDSDVDRDYLKEGSLLYI